MLKSAKLLNRLVAGIGRAMLLALLAFPAPAFAQSSTTTYTNSTSGTISNSNCNMNTRTFNVTSNVVITDVTLGAIAATTYRGNIRLILVSPTGTSAQLVNGVAPPTSVPGDNFNVNLSDGAGQTINSTATTTNHSTSVAPFQYSFRPNAALSAFDGQPSAGTWTLQICEVDTSFMYGNITFNSATLAITGNTVADLSLNKTVSSATPASGANVTYTLTASNAAASGATANGVTVDDLLPAGTTYVSHSTAAGTYNSGTGVWSIGSIAPGQSRTLSITVNVNASAGATIVNEAEITASSATDPDSTPNNGATGEDDYDSASFTVSGSRVAGTAPTLICPKSTIAFDWDTRAWTTGATSASYNVTGLGTLAFGITNPGAWLNMFGGTNPVRTNQLTGGLFPAQYSLAQTVDMASRTQVVTTTITLPMAVDGVQFRIFDVDYSGGQFADRVRITGSYGGLPVGAVLTNGVTNYVIGNQAFGDGLSGDTSGNGNVTVTFTSTVDTIVIEYGNHSLAPTNPGQQAISIHDITFCAPNAELSVTKTSTLISDPVRGTTNPVLIPGAVVSYCLYVRNTGSAPATSIVATDPFPTNMTYVANSMRMGLTCESATVFEDDNATGADESDPIGASVTSTELRVTAPLLDSSEEGALVFQMTVN